MTISGAIPRVEANRSHRLFIEAVQPEQVMLSLVEARKLVKRGETSDSYFGSETDAVVTSTISDKKLDLISWEKEYEIISEFAPEYHIPTDYSIYSTQSGEFRRNELEKCMQGARWMQEKLDESDTEIIPLIKGIEERERRICYRAYDIINPEQIAFYATQYFSAGAGNNINELRNDVSTICNETDRDLILIGLMSPTYLESLSPQIVAGAGMNQWYRDMAPTEQTETEMRSMYTDIKNKVSDALTNEPTA